MTSERLVTVSTVSPSDFTISNSLSVLILTFAPSDIDLINASEALLTSSSAPVLLAITNFTFSVGTRVSGSVSVVPSSSMLSTPPTTTAFSLSIAPLSSIP